MFVSQFSERGAHQVGGDQIGVADLLRCGFRRHRASFLVRVLKSFVLEEQ